MNQDLYKKMGKKIALSSLDGINGTIFMYGQTGSGKTFTMMGSADLDPEKRALRYVQQGETINLFEESSKPCY